MIRNLGELGPCLQSICKRLLANQNLMKLLYYSDKDPFGQLDLTEYQIEHDIFNKLILFVPRISPAKDDARSLISLRVYKGLSNLQNDQFMDIRFAIEVFVPMTQWVIKDENLRPFAIMGEIQKSLVGKHIGGIGKIMGGNFELNFLTEEMSCYEMSFQITNYD